MQSADHRIIQCPGFERYQELEAVLVSGQLGQVTKET